MRTDDLADKTTSDGRSNLIEKDLEKEIKIVHMMIPLIGLTEEDLAMLIMMIEWIGEIEEATGRIGDVDVYFLLLQMLFVRGAALFALFEVC